MNKPGFELHLRKRRLRESWLTTKPRGPNGLPLVGGVTFGVFRQDTLAAEVIWRTQASSIQFSISNPSFSFVPIPSPGCEGYGICQKSNRQESNALL
jgi:hypothetical protein